MKPRKAFLVVLLWQSLNVNVQAFTSSVDTTLYTAKDGRQRSKRLHMPVQHQLYTSRGCQSTWQIESLVRRMSKSRTRLKNSSDDVGGSRNEESSNNKRKRDEQHDFKKTTTDQAEDSTKDVSMSSDSSPKSQASTLPSYRRLALFTATTILIWISEPLLSLVDTTIVGRTASPKLAVVQIAALGPATTLYDSAIYMTYFLAIAATNLISPSLAERNWKQLRKSTSHLLGLALVFGLAVSIFTFALGPMLIRQMVGNSANDLAMIPLAVQYAKIRAAVAPFSVVDFVAQSFCLTTLDTRTPAFAVAVASIVNIVGDLLLSPRWGIQGAAVATALATISSCLILIRKVQQQTNEWKVFQYKEAEGETNFYKEKALVQPPKTKVVDGSIELVAEDSQDKIQQSGGAEDEVKGESESNLPSMSSTDDQDEGASKKKKGRLGSEIPFFSFPDQKALLELVNLAGPIFFVMMGKIACYSILTVRATQLGILPLAAHNIMMRAFFFFACFGDSLSQAAQTFFPQVPPKLRGRLTKRLLHLSTGVGLTISQASVFILSHLGGYLTKDSRIIDQMAQFSIYVGASVLLHPFIMLLEGTILAQRDLMYLVAMYAMTMVFHYGMVLSPITNTFSGLWQVFFAFQLSRLVQCAGRLVFRLWKGMAPRTSA